MAFVVAERLKEKTNIRLLTEAIIVQVEHKLKVCSFGVSLSYKTLNSFYVQSKIAGKAPAKKRVQDYVR
jgi:hypothetical protein